MSKNGLKLALSERQFKLEKCKTWFNTNLGQFKKVLYDGYKLAIYYK